MAGRQNQERHHHYVAAFHLAGFTVEGLKTSRLFVIDQSSGKEWPSTPLESAKQRDYNAVETPRDQNPNVIERAFGSIETQAAEVFREIVQSQKMPAGPQREIFINYVALAAARLPWMRVVASHVAEKFLKSWIRQRFTGPGAFENISADFTRHGLEFSEQRFEDMRAVVQADDYSIDLDQTAQVMLTFEASIAFATHLAERHWTLAILDEGAPDLICSDRLVSLVPPANVPLKKVPHVKDRNTMLMMPVTRRIVACGTYVRAKPPRTTGTFQVAALNSYTAQGARYLFHAGPDLTILAPDRATIWGKAEALRHLRQGPSGAI
jgi:hypothetical protein